MDAGRLTVGISSASAGGITAGMLAAHGAATPLPWLIVLVLFIGATAMAWTDHFLVAWLAVALVGLRIVLAGAQLLILALPALGVAAGLVMAWHAHRHRAIDWERFG